MRDVKTLKLSSIPGSVQPSHHILLKFYAYYKQATEGPNTSPKPAFWEIVKKAKWEAWSKLGDMDQETAMKNYVEEFKKVIRNLVLYIRKNCCEIKNFFLDRRSHCQRKRRQLR